jgi:hypothetical protein
MKRQDMQWLYMEDGEIMNGFWSWLLDFVKKNPLSIVGILMLFFGGAFAVIVSAKNGYLPDVNLVDVTATLFAIALVGLAVIVSVAIAFFSSAFLIVYIKPNLNTPWNRLVFVLPSLLTALYLAFIVFSFSPPLPAEWFIIGVLVITFLGLFFSWFKNYSPCTPKANIKDLCRVFISGFVLLLGLCSILPVMLEILSRQQDDERTAFFLLEFFIIVWCGVNFVLIDSFLNRKIKKLRVISYVILSIFGIPLLLSALAGNITMVPAATFRLLGLGEIPVTLALTENACSALEQQTDSNSIRCQQGIVKNVMLKSRIGGWFMVEPILEKNNSGDHGDVQKFFIRKEDVKFWIRERDKDELVDVLITEDGGSISSPDSISAGSSNSSNSNTGNIGIGGAIEKAHPGERRENPKQDNPSR